jgi:hypothetical protein
METIGNALCSDVSRMMPLSNTDLRGVVLAGAGATRVQIESILRRAIKKFFIRYFL